MSRPLSMLMGLAVAAVVGVAAPPASAAEFTCHAEVTKAKGGKSTESCGERFEAKDAKTAATLCATPRDQARDGVAGQGCCEQLSFHYRIDPKSKIELRTIRQSPYKSFDDKAVCPPPAQ